MEITEEGKTLQREPIVEVKGVEDEELKVLLTPDVKDLPLIPPSSVESNFVRYYVTGTP